MRRDVTGVLWVALTLVACSKADGEAIGNLPTSETADPLGAVSVLEIGKCVSDCRAEPSGDGVGGDGAGGAEQRCRERCVIACRKDCQRHSVSSSFVPKCHADCERQLETLEK
jgi:hypothetical protein